MKQLFTFILLATVFITNAQEVTLTKTDVNGKLSLDVPTTFRALSVEEVVRQYGSARVPEVVYNDETSRDIVLSISVRVDTINSTIDYKSIKTTQDSTDLLIEKSFYRASLGAIYSELKFITDEVRTIKNKPFMLFEFTSTLEGKNGKGDDAISKQYNYIAHGFKGKKKLIVTFSCPIEQQSTWQPVARKIIESISF